MREERSKLAIFAFFFFRSARMEFFRSREITRVMCCNGWKTEGGKNRNRLPLLGELFGKIGLLFVRTICFVLLWNWVATTVYVQCTR